MPRTIDPIKNLTKEFKEFQAEMRQRVNTLESERPGRKPKPVLAYKQRDVCALDPERDSDTCGDASIYRYQTGCHGAACRLKQHEAYERRKVNGSRRRTGEAIEVGPKKRKVSPSKRAIKAPIRSVTTTPTTTVSKRPTTPSKKVAKAS